VAEGYGLEYARALASFERGTEAAAARQNVERSS
jgi:hypothetical protein